MRPQDYPPQEPVSAVATPYRDACMMNSFGVPFSDFQYGSDPYQSIAIYSPAKPDGRLFAFIHGGGWVSGYKEWMSFMAPAFTAVGITFASIGYRLAPKYVFPAAYDDCAAAVQYLWKNAASFGADPKRLAVGGHSAGGHYGSLLAVKRDWQAKLGLPIDVIKICLPISGVFRFGTGSGLPARPRFLGPEDSSAETPASPVLNIQGAPPPFFIAHGDRDFPHLMTQGAEMETALHNAGGEVSRLVMTDRDHFTASLAGGEVDGPWVPQARTWLQRL
ncbi:MAG TPA: alpha/beta hydrolase [Magnetospirillaceae bacterium]|jgi:acetyl esterase/lipase